MVNVDLVGVPEAAIILRVNRATVWRWVGQGKLPVASRIMSVDRLRTRCLLNRRDVERLAAERAAESAA